MIVLIEFKINLFSIYYFNYLIIVWEIEEKFSKENMKIFKLYKFNNY